MQAAFPPGQGESVVASHGLVASLVRTLRDMQNEFGLDGRGGGVRPHAVPGRAGARGRRREAAARSRGPASSSSWTRPSTDLLAMRRAEGGRLRDDLERGMAMVESSAARIEALSGLRAGSSTRLARRARARLDRRAGPRGRAALPGGGARRGAARRDRGAAAAAQPRGAWPGVSSREAPPRGSGWTSWPRR